MTIPTKHAAPGTAILINENFRGFNGEIFDSASSGYLPGNGYRPYNPKAGTFLCRDSLSPFGQAGENRYQYCHLDPINNADPTGHLSWQAGVGIGFGILGLLLSVFTFGASLALVAGGAVVAGALGVTSGVLGLASTATGIASSALEESDPATSATLGWVSFGLGLGSAVTGIGGAGLARAGADPWRAVTISVIRNRSVYTAAARNGFRYVRNNSGARVWLSKYRVRGSFLRDYVDDATNRGRDVHILSGTHGGRYGRRTLSMRKRSFYFQDKASFKNDANVTVHDIWSLSHNSLNNIVNGTDEVIAAFCYSRNDRVIRHLLGLQSTTSFVRTP